MDVTFDDVRARVSLLSLLTGTVDVTFNAHLAGGALEGEVEVGDASSLRVNITEPIHLQRVSIIRAFIGLPLAGTLSGDVDVTLPAEIREASGSVSLVADRLRIGDDQAKLRLPGMANGVTLERINAGRLRIQLAIEGGVATVERLRSRGEDAELDGEGTINLMRPIKQSRLDLLVRLKVLDAYREQSDRTRAMISVLDSMPALSRARTSDGALQYRLGGSVGGGVRSSSAGSTRMRIAPDDEDDLPSAGPSSMAAGPTTAPAEAEAETESP